MPLGRVVEKSVCVTGTGSGTGSRPRDRGHDGTRGSSRGRTVADGGQSFYVQGDHKAAVPALYDAIGKRESDVRGTGAK